jgi:prevent-host-death family protein
MSRYSVAEAKNTLPSLIDKAAAGEEVVITRHGKPVAEIRPITSQEQRPNKATYDWLRSRRDKRKGIAITSVELLNQMYDETDY